MTLHTRYRSHGDRLDLLVCGECSSRTTLVSISRDEVEDHDAWHDDADPVPGRFVLNLDRPERPAGLPLDAFEALVSAVATNRALGTTGAKTRTTTLALDAVRRPGTAVYDVIASCVLCEYPAGADEWAPLSGQHAGWCPIGSTDEELDDRAHVHLEHDATDCDGSHSYQSTHFHRDSTIKDVDEWIWREVADLVSLSGFGGRLDVRQEDPTTYHGLGVSWDVYGPYDGSRGKIRPETVATWSEPTEEGGRTVSIRVCYSRCSA
jgi:hypothetical protein